MNGDILIKHYQQIWRDLDEVKKYILVAMLIFVTGNILAFLIPKLGEAVLSSLLEYFKTFENKNGLELLVAIFLKNAFSAFISILFGFFFGLVPVVGAVFNGIVIGAILNLNPLNFFKIIPHGLFELPAIFIAWGLGIWCGGGLFHSPIFKTISFRIKKSLNIYLSIIVPLLIIAAIIEVFVTKIILSI